MTQVPAKPSAPPARTPAPVRKRDGKPLSQRDLFQLDSPLYGEIRGERSLMAFPFFALSKNAWMKPLSYEHATVSIEVRPSANGVATIYDKEIVLYIASLMAAKLEAGEDVAQDFVFTAHDLFSVTGSNHSARSYQRLSEALERLQGTQIKTNIEAGGEGEEGFFSWLSEARLHYSKTKTGERRLKAVKVRLCDWLFRAILRDRQVLNYAATYFQLGPIERRIYEVARSTCEDGRMEIDLATFRLQIGYQNPLSNFRAAMRGIAGTDAIPDYAIELIEDEAPAPAADVGEGAQRRGRRAAPARVVINYRPEQASEATDEDVSGLIDGGAESPATGAHESTRGLPE
ncbi:replication initiator protein A [uncultured Sphingomonas sp.]|uniref:replication initiator protein A n=1 Tax=uncultured Sphingomonas sp. TaxID=158754 RepID=UPI002623354C|nr:replication initiator protein A [uncultured Sphingomonas sp.]